MVIEQGEWQIGAAYGLCIVSKNDKFRIIGKWYNGNKVGMEDDFIIASRIENISSGIVFDTV